MFDEGGDLIASLPVDTRTVPQVVPGDPTVVDGPVELVQLLLASGKLEACLARQYFRFTFGRWEDLTRDGCALERLRTRLMESGSIRQMLEQVALDPAFKQRTFALQAPAPGQGD